MENKLKNLTEKLYNEGILEGNKKAELIINNATQNAEEIINNANKKAEEIISTANLEAKKIYERVNTELEAAYKQSINQLKTKLTDLITLKTINTNEINASLMKQEFIENMILNILKNYNPNQDQNIDLALHFHKDSKEYIASFIKNNCKEYLNKGLEVKFDRTGSGFSIKPKDESYELSFDDKTLFNFFSNNLKQYTKNILFN